MRDYDPTTGRYLQPDPLGLVAGMNVYGYANQSPMSYIDPDGRNPVLACLINPVCRTAAGAAVGVLVGWLLDPDCFTWKEALLWAADGALFANGFKPGRGPGGKPKPGPSGPKPLHDHSRDELMDGAKGPFSGVNEAGEAIGLGKGESGIKDAIEKLTEGAVEEMKRKGVTREQLQAMEEIYRRAVENGKGGSVAPLRLGYVQALLNLW